MKSVDNPSSFLFRPDAASASSANTQQKKKTEKSSFLSIFRSGAGDNDEEQGSSPGGISEQEIEKHLDRIHMLGQGLVKNHGIEQIREYKKAVQSLMKYFVDTGLRAEEQVSSRNILNQKKYYIVKVIDEKLEHLVAAVLQSQTKQIDILAKLEEIQGLLVDLMH